MLLRLIVRDFVIVDRLELEFGGGFGALTGETGAGKSILIDALQLALGARADAGVVREGAQRCEISATFDAPAALAGWLDQAGFAAEDDLLLRRTIDTQGKSRAWINGSPATATQLREIADLLVDIHGQHAWQSLTRPEAVRGLLDAYAGVPAQALAQPWQAWRSAHKALLDAREAQDSLQRERERLAWQIGELDKLAPGEHEWEELNTQHSRLSNVQALRDAVQTAVDALQEFCGTKLNLQRRAWVAVATCVEPTSLRQVFGKFKTKKAEYLKQWQTLHGEAEAKKSVCERFKGKLTEYSKIMSTQINQAATACRNCFFC